MSLAAVPLLARAPTIASAPSSTVDANLTTLERLVERKVEARLPASNDVGPLVVDPGKLAS